MLGPVQCQAFPKLKLIRDLPAGTGSGSHRAFLGQDPGDVSNLEDTAIMDYITEVGRIRDRPDDFQGMSI